MEIDDYIADGLNRDLKDPAATVVYLYLSKHMAGAKCVQMSYQKIANGTGISKRTVQRAIEALKEARLIKATLESPTAEPKYTVMKARRGIR